MERGRKAATVRVIYVRPRNNLYVCGDDSLGMVNDDEDEPLVTCAAIGPVAAWPIIIEQT